MSFIDVNNLWKCYGDSVVLERVNTKVNAGEFITIVGTSGCGKTTFLNMLLGIESATKGELLLEGAPVIDEPNEDRGIVFQRYSVFPHLNVLDNVILPIEFEQSRFWGKLFNEKRQAAYEKAYQMLELVGLSAAKNKYPHELSGGMQQRLAIAQALMKSPKILLLDEPFGALDPGIRKDMYKLILDIWRKTGVTIFMITHDLGEGFYLGTRLWVFDKVRYEPDNPNAYGATITYDIPVGKCDTQTYQEIDQSLIKNKLNNHTLEGQI